MSNIALDSFPAPQEATGQRLPTSTAGSARTGTTAPIGVSRPMQQFQPTNQTTESQSSGRELTRITNELQRRVSTVAPELQFSVDRSSGRSVIKITDPTTNEVIRQIPSEEVLQIAKGLDKFQKGLLFNGKA